MRAVFFLFSFSLLLLAELFLGGSGIFIPLVWFGCFYFGAKEEFFAAAAGSLLFGALSWGICGRDMLTGMLAALFFALCGMLLRDWRNSGLFHLVAGEGIFCLGGTGAMWISAVQRGALAQEWGLLTAQTVFWAVAGIAVSSLLCRVLNLLAVRIGAAPELNKRKRRSPWNG